VSTIETYHRPSTVDEAWARLTEGGKHARLVGGGVDVALFDPPEITTLVDVAGALSTTIERTENGLNIGVGATLTAVLESPIVAEYLGGILVDVLRRVASPLLRNAATVGGSLASTHPWSDVITLFLALDAHVTRYGGAYESAPLAELIKDRGTMNRRIITGVLLPSPAPQTVVSFEKFVRTGFDVGMLNCACRLTLEDGACTDVRVVFGGTPDVGGRRDAVESRLTGARLDAATIDAVADLAATDVPARDDVRASAAYRRVLASAGVRRCLRRMAQEAGEAT